MTGKDILFFFLFYKKEKALELQMEDFYFGDSAHRRERRTASSALLRTRAGSVQISRLEMFQLHLSALSVVVDTCCASLLMQPSLQEEKKKGPMETVEPPSGNNTEERH